MWVRSGEGFGTDHRRQEQSIRWLCQYCLEQELIEFRYNITEIYEHIKESMKQAALDDIRGEEYTTSRHYKYHNKKWRMG